MMMKMKFQKEFCWFEPEKEVPEVGYIEHGSFSEVSKTNMAAAIALYCGAIRLKRT